MLYFDIQSSKSIALCIEISLTSFQRFVDNETRKVSALYRNMSPEERGQMMNNFREIDESEGGESDNS